MSVNNRKMYIISAYMVINIVYFFCNIMYILYIYCKIFINILQIYLYDKIKLIYLIDKLYFYLLSHLNKYKNINFEWIICDLFYKFTL